MEKRRPNVAKNNPQVLRKTEKHIQKRTADIKASENRLCTSRSRRKQEVFR